MELDKVIIKECSSLGLVVSNESKLFGTEGLLDSMGLVNLVVMLEERIQDEYGVVITLADERALSRSQSPFLTFSSLKEYIKVLLREEGINV